MILTVVEEVGRNGDIGVVSGDGGAHSEGGGGLRHAVAAHAVGLRLLAAHLAHHGATPIAKEESGQRMSGAK